MALSNKTIRYYYWIAIAFTQKNIKLILLSFLLSIVGIISIISVAPYLISYTTSKKDTIGIVGSYDYNNLPDEVITKISNGLVFINERGEVVPVLVDSWEVADKGREYRFHIKKNLYWNDGSKFTAKDVTYKFKDVESQVVNDYLLVFKLKNPLPIFLTYLTTPIVKYPLVGVAGLYKVDRVKTRFDSVTEIYLTPNKEGLPSYVYKFYQDEAKLVNAYKLSEISEMTITKKSVADIFKTWKNTKITKNVNYNLLLTLFFNMNNPYLKEAKDIRQAVAAAIDRKKLADIGEEALGPIPPISWAYNPNLKRLQEDPDLAKKILKRSADATDSAALNLSSSYENADITEAIAEDLRAAGLNIKTNTISYGQTDSFDMLLAFWKVPLDPDQYYFWHSRQTQGNITNYKNFKVDKLLEDGRTTTSVEERKKIYAQFQRVIIDDLPAFFMYYPYSYTIKRI